MSNLSSDAKAFHVISAYKLSAAEEKQIVSDLSDKYTLFHTFFQLTFISSLLQYSYDVGCSKHIS
ncbi:MAG TPA: hypothetical protein DCQ65_00705, partial [Gammaproteobacteria bacterium]|nr:hypothetical protein [Gammaproteobacteria bacterium]